MQKITVKQAHLTRQRIALWLGSAAFILALSPGYAQAGYGIAPIVKPIPSITAGTNASKRISGSDIAYEAPMASAPAPQPVVIQGAPNKSGVVEGFADQVPLNVAMQQVLPQGMGYSLADGVNPGQLVSWRGGRPWQAVMQDMLAPSGLTYSANGGLITVSNPHGGPAVISGNAPSMSPQAMTMPASAAPMPPQPTYDSSYSAAPPPYQPGQQYGDMPNAAPQPMQMQQPMMQQPMMQQPMQQPMMTQQQMQQPMPMPQPIYQQQAPMQQPMFQPMMTQQMPPPMPEMGPPPGSTGSPQQASAAAQPLQIQNPALFQPQSWDAKPGQTLRAILQDWCGRVGAELNWQAEYDYPVMASLNMTGTFEEAVRTILAGFNSAKPVPYGHLHYNPAAGQSILIVEASGNHYGD